MKPPMDYATPTEQRQYRRLGWIALIGLVFGLFGIFSGSYFTALIVIGVCVYIYVQEKKLNNQRAVRYEQKMQHPSNLWRNQ